MVNVRGAAGKGNRHGIQGRDWRDRVMVRNVRLNYIYIDHTALLWVLYPAALAGEVEPRRGTKTHPTTSIIVPRQRLIGQLLSSNSLRSPIDKETIIRPPHEVDLTGLTIRKLEFLSNTK